MFDRNHSAFPGHQYVDSCGNEIDPGPTKFEQCAKDFTAAWIPVCSQEQRTNDTTAIQNAVRLGILVAEEFCRQMEEREKDGSKGD